VSDSKPLAEATAKTALLAINPTWGRRRGFDAMVKQVANAMEAFGRILVDKETDECAKLAREYQRSEGDWAPDLNLNLDLISWIGDGWARDIAADIRARKTRREG
jgi:hypothetical protein